MGFLYLTAAALGEQPRGAGPARQRLANPRCYHHSGMKPQTIGRALGIGVRIAGRIAGQRIAAGAQTAGSAPAAPETATGAALRGVVAHSAETRAAGRTAGRAIGSVARGVGGFLRPFRRVGGILWLEVTGVFFLIFVPVFFWRGIWPIRADWARGPGHWKFLVYAGLTLVFLYLGVSSFWRARKR